MVCKVHQRVFHGRPVVTEERLREIANSYLRCTSMDMAKSLDDTIRLALAERDREIAEWVKARDGEHPEELEEDLLAYLEAGG